MHDANLALLAIKLGKIHSEILRYIALYFNFNIDDELRQSDIESSEDESDCEDSD